VCLSVLNTCTRTTFAHLFLCAYARTRAAVSMCACVYVCLCCESLPPPSHTHTHTQQGCLAPSTLSDTSLMRVRAHTHTHACIPTHTCIHTHSLSRARARTHTHTRQELVSRDASEYEAALATNHQVVLYPHEGERERERVSSREFRSYWNSLGRVKKTKNLNITRLARGERLAR
jgi:hypothetical protein